MAANVFSVVKVSSQALLANEFVVFDEELFKAVCMELMPTGTGVRLPCKGRYHVSLDLDFTPTATGEFAVEILKNGVVLPAAVATNQGTLSEPTHVHVQGEFSVLKSCECIDNTALIQVAVTAAGTVSNANLVVERID